MSANNLSEEEYNALVRDAMHWRKHCLLSETGEKDAERYRWLVMNMRVARAGTDGVRHYIDVPPAVSMDEAIDLAMRGEKHGTR